MAESTLAHYRVGAQLGQGGMGVVYQATDTRLGRQVALKLLHDSSVSDPGRLARFEREARLLAALNHPNIGSIYGIEHDGGRSFLVLEYIPGDTLSERIGRGAMPVREALEVARQVAHALEGAHEAGIIHRDLKPGNIKITPEGGVKVLDFGLAKAQVGASDESDTLVRPDMAIDVSQPGVVMGTVAYMSPEQASGKPVDHRTDIWAFGCVLFEMLAGKLTFPGTSTTEVLVGILDREPDWNSLPPATPDNIRSLLRRCLSKDARARLHSAADARLELEETLAGKITSPLVVQPRPSRARWAPAVAIAIAVAGVASSAWMWMRKTAPVSPRVVRFAVDLPEGSRLRPSWDEHMTFSRDSSTLFYPVNDPPPLVMHARRLDAAQGGAVEDMKGLSRPLYSPDGRWVVLADIQKGQLVKRPLSGGAAIPIARLEMPFRGDWGTDGYIYWTNQLMGPMIRTPQDGGPNETVIPLDESTGERTQRFVRVLPGGKALIFTSATADIESYDDARIDLFDLTTKKRKTLVQGGTSARYSPSGHIVYARAGSLYAVPFDLGKLEVTGTPVKVLDGVLMSTSIGAVSYDISPQGDLAYAAGPAENGERMLYWVDRKGNAKALPLPPRPYLNPRISPDGKQLAIEVEGANHDLYVYDFEREVMSRLTNDGVSHAPIWSPDGSHIAFRTWIGGKMKVAWMPSDRSAPPQRLVGTDTWQSAVSFSPDGKYMTFDNMERPGDANVWVLALGGDRKARPFVETKFSEGGAKFSPDGHRIVYCSVESGKPEVYVQEWPGPGRKVQISSEGGIDPVWRRDGKEIFYRNGSRMMVVPISLQPEFRPGKPELLWTADYMFGLSSSCGLRGPTITSYDVTPDGQRLLMIKDNDSKLFATKIVVVVNWAEELKRLMAEAAAEKRPTARAAVN